MRMFNFNDVVDPVDEDVHSFYKENGFVLFRGFLSELQIANLRTKVDVLALKEIENHSADLYGDRMQRVWNLVNKDVVFQDAIVAQKLLNIVDKIFERPTSHMRYYLSSFQANILRPGASAQKLHIDTPVPDPLPPWEMKINTIWLLDDFTEFNGSTEIIPGSHKFGRRPISSCDDDHTGLIKVIAPAGSMLLTSGTLWHRSGANQSVADRRVLLGSFAASFFREISSEEDIVHFQLKNPNLTISSDCWRVVGGEHGIKTGWRPSKSESLQHYSALSGAVR